MENYFDILIIGAGNAGISAAARLRKRNSRFTIGIIEPSARHYYQPAWTLVGAGTFDINKTVKPQAKIIPHGITWIKDSVATFDPANNSLQCSSGDVYLYDVLVVTPGIHLAWNKIEGLKATLGRHNVSSNYSFDLAPYTWEMIRSFKGGTAVFTNPATPIKCGGAPHKIMYLACDYWRRKGILDKCDVHYLSGAGAIFAVPEYAATLEKKIKEYGIHTHFGVQVTRISGEDKTVWYEEKDKEGNTVTQSLHFDLCHAVPPQEALPFIKASPLAAPANPYGYVEVNKHTFQHMRYPNIFSCGDTTNAPCSKTGAAIRRQVPVMTDHIIAYLEGKTSDKKYNGYSACPIPTQYGKLMLAEFDYDNKPTMSFPFNQTRPRRSMWILKKYILPWLYWHRILKGSA